MTGKDTKLLIVIAVIGPVPKNRPENDCILADVLRI